MWLGAGLLELVGPAVCPAFRSEGAQNSRKLRPIFEPKKEGV